MELKPCKKCRELPTLHVMSSKDKRGNVFSPEELYRIECCVHKQHCYRPKTRAVEDWNARM